MPQQVWSEQEFGALKKGFDPYSPTPDSDFAQLQDLRLNLYTLDDAWFVVANGLDGIIVRSEA